MQNMRGCATFIELDNEDLISLEVSVDTLLRSGNFLGYAKPKRVEVGQRWECEAIHLPPSVVTQTDGDVALFGSRAAYGFQMLSNPHWTYLGVDDTHAKIRDVATQMAAAGGMGADSVMEQIEMLRAPKFGLNTPEEFARIVGSPIRSRGKGPAISVDTRVPNQASVDFHAATQRSASGRAIVDLVNNPPAWAEPTAWRAAVLCVWELAAMVDGSHPSFAEYMRDARIALESYVTSRRSMAHDSALRSTLTNLAKNGGDTVLITAAVSAYDRTRFQPSQRVASVGRERVRR